ncbi:reverse transcriptase [Pochonia chlamydosporia 170]|uniref:Reverse transcriptase n=1 Tax=Pochonia chlamydosporia 170 TaxID=1380566 RepID=A0A219AN21_METCM|nr:reverse transcriptase [Pochonia chlamydosporia 170]OWT42238.1 reverse transcriptase [Pochonia chlamydosporia 170]
MNAVASVGTNAGPRGRLSTPTGRRVVKRKIDDQGKEPNKSSRYATRTTTDATAIELECATDIRNGNRSDSTDEGGATLQSALLLLGQFRAEFHGLKTAIKEQSEIIRNQQDTIRELKEATEAQQSHIKDLTQLFEDTKQQMGHDLKRAHELLEAIAGRTQATPPSSFADVARSSPQPQPGKVRMPPPANTRASSLASEFYCTIDTSRVEESDRDRAQVGAIRQAIESEIKAKDGQATWKCAAVMKEARNAERVKIICRDENELKQVKEAAQKTAIVGTRVMRDQRYPVKVDNANRTMVLDAEGNILPGATEALGTENNVNIAKMSWLSNKQSGKAYGSMVVYVTKGSDARRLLDGRYFDLAGESAITNAFEPRKGPVQCYNCQEIGHKSFQCKNPQLCGRCAMPGHHHKECQVVEPKCVPCGGPHESFSRNCRVRNVCSDE